MGQLIYSATRAIIFQEKLSNALKLVNCTSVEIAWRTYAKKDVVYVSVFPFFVERDWTEIIAKGTGRTNARREKLRDFFLILSQSDCLQIEYQNFFKILVVGGCKQSAVNLLSVLASRISVIECPSVTNISSRK